MALAPSLVGWYITGNTVGFDGAPADSYDWPLHKQAEGCLAPGELENALVQQCHLTPLTPGPHRLRREGDKGRI